MAGPGSLRDVERDIVALDRSVYAAIAQTPTPTLDDALRRLSDAADNSKLWLGIAAAIAATGGRDGRRTAALGVAAIGITSATVNLAGKRLFDRARPDRAGVDVPLPRHVRMPTSTSFPSGHSASAFAFANAIAGQWPVAGFPLRALASAVAYSRVHTGVHYPSDVLIGAIIGAAIGDVVTAVGRRYWTKPL
jgi:undecaprenyl-diphosphatase